MNTKDFLLFFGGTLLSGFLLLVFLSDALIVSEALIEYINKPKGEI